jgi:cell shape-determining protein MreD
MLRYLVYIIALYVALTLNAFVDVLTIIIFFIIMKEDARVALVFSFLTGLLVDLYTPVQLGVNTLLLLILTQTLLFLKKFLVVNPLTNFATFLVFYLIKTALANILVSAPINTLYIVYTIVAFFPVTIILNRINFRIWMRV